MPESWSAYKNDDFGFSFGYPSSFGDLKNGELSPNILLNLSTIDKSDLGQNLKGPLTVMVLSKDTPVIKTDKYGPLVKAIYLDDKKINFWQVTVRSDGELYDQYHEGDKYPIKSQNRESRNPPHLVPQQYT